jgi:hypothetical protein
MLSGVERHAAKGVGEVAAAVESLTGVVGQRPGKHWIHARQIGTPVAELRHPPR